MPIDDAVGEGETKAPESAKTGETWLGVPKKVLIWAALLGALVGIIAVVRRYPTGGLASTLSSLRFWLAILPACIILHHAVFLRLSRRSQLVTALAPQAVNADTGREAIADKYFGWGMLAARYVPPAIIVTVLCWFALDVLAAPPGSLDQIAATPPGGTPVPDGGAYAWLFGRQSAEAVPILRGARFGFAGAYLYTLILLAQRGFRRDITGGVAMWAAALFVAGPLSGALAALLVTGVIGDGGAFVRDTVYVFAGMLPREFSLYLQGNARRMLNPAAAAFGMRNIPVSILRGATPAIEERFAEEGIEDVVALAYANPFQLIRATSYGTRQIVQWIDESLLIATVPEGWQDLEKAGITGAIDLAWCRNEPKELKDALAKAIKMEPPFLEAVTRRLDEDAQVAELRRFYWTDDDRSGVSFELAQGVSPNDLHALVASMAPDVSIEQQGLVVTLRKVATKDREPVSAALNADSRVKPGSVKLVG